MKFLDENTSRADLEIAAIFECNFSCEVVEKASDKELLEMIRNWIEEGDETA